MSAPTLDEQASANAWAAYVREPGLLAELARLQTQAEALREAWQRVDSQLSRILHEMGGSCSMCWEPRPSNQVFESTKAAEFVAEAIAEIRALASAGSGKK
jgi:hypothetical protein